MLGLLSCKSLEQMQQSRELLQQSLAAVPLRSPFRIYVEKSVGYLETMILDCCSVRLAVQLPGTLMAVNFSPTTIVGRQEPGSEWKMAPNWPWRLVTPHVSVRSNLSLSRQADHFRFTSESRYIQSPSACLKGARSGQGKNLSGPLIYCPVACFWTGVTKERPQRGGELGPKFTERKVPEGDRHDSDVGSQAGDTH
jgi:hypothetical protein